jgi:hypothetical protein
LTDVNSRRRVGSSVAERPPHREPDVESALTWAETQSDTSIRVRRRGRIYGTLWHREGEADGSDRIIDEKPRHPPYYADEIVRFVERALAQAEIRDRLE